VVVNTLADFFRAKIAGCGARLFREEAGAEHTVFVYGVAGGANMGAAEIFSPGNRSSFLQSFPFYLRSSARYEMEGVGYHIDAVHGAAEFDSPSGAAEAAAKLLCRLGPVKLFSSEVSAALIHEGGQGHFPVWLIKLLEQRELPGPNMLVLHGRNILGLEAARHNIAANSPGAASRQPRIVPGVELDQKLAELAAAEGLPAPQGYGFIAAFPQSVPQTDRFDSIWEGLKNLLLPGGAAILAFPSTEADRFDKRKPSGFTRLGDLKRQGFRALGYRTV
jgi:hypothetical protein